MIPDESGGKTIKFSVLVAVYNAAPYLRACLDSILHQSVDDLQILCVDDASTDDSAQILSEYAARDERVEVIRLDQNQGQAAARNVALSRAKGEWVLMVDADDLSAEGKRFIVRASSSSAKTGRRRTRRLRAKKLARRRSIGR